jgi:di/tricarboxylate transporter
VEQANQSVSPVDGVDRAALLLAGVGTVVTLALAAGDWTPWSSVVGLTFLVITWAFHRATPTTRTPRSALMRIAFGSVSALCVLLAAASPLRSLSPAAASHGWVRSIIWLVLAAVISFLEPRIAGWLDQERRKA